MEWMAPIRAQASIVIASSGIIGMYRVTTSPVINSDAQMVTEENKSNQLLVQVDLMLMCVLRDITQFNIILFARLPFCTPIDFMTLAILDT